MKTKLIIPITRFPRAMITIVMLMLLSLNICAANAATNISAVNQESAKPKAMVFVSFSMPEDLLKSTLEEAAYYRIPVLLRGFVDGNLRKTLDKLFELSKKIPNLSLQIDPEGFKKYHINEVPAVVVADNHGFDVIYGNLTIQAALEKIADKGETKINLADFIVKGGPHAK